ncbi:MAG: hotdog domain-containing protein [Leptolinea sp.]
MEPITCVSNHLVKSEDLNHHGTLYAGRSAEWFVEAGFIAAARLLPPNSIVCLKIHGMTFTRPVRCGEIATYSSKIIYTGKTSLVAFVEMFAKDELVVKGLITFIHVDENSIPMEHGITIVPVTDVDKKLQETAISETRKK